MADNNLAGVGVLRQRFHVELKPDETTFVSWKKLVKDLPKAVQNLPFEPPAGAHPALQARIAPEVEATTGNSLLQNDPPVSPPPNRFSAVIEKIERLYKGDESSEEEQLDKNPDDDQYDTEDSFIDDTELDEYFSVDKAKTKHTGFFVNRGKLEPVNEPASPVLAPKKRKRKDIKKAPNTEEIPKKLLKMGAVRIKAAARTAPLVGMNVKSSGQDITCLAVNEYSDDKASRKQESKTTSISCESGLLKAGFQEAASKVEPLVKRVKACDKNGGNLNGFLPGCKDSSVHGEIVTEPSDNDIFNHLSKHTNSRDDCQTRESVKGVSDMSTPDKTIAIERAGEDSISRDVGNKLSMIKVKPSLSGSKEAILARPKCTILEKAFQDLEKGVVELCPPTADVRESEQFQGVKKRLPREVKQKLGKVARLAAKQGKISDEVIGRLMGVLGHVMRLKTLKRNLKEMVESGISAKQEKEGRIQDIKKEVTKMVQMQVSSLQAQDAGWQGGSTDDFQGASCTGEKGKSNGCYKWDNATEDAICNLYDQYVEGMDEHKGPQIKKLYIELAELWPQGWMDNNGIKHAVYRAKERKKKMNKLSNGVETTKRKKTPVKSNTDGSNGDGPAGSVSNLNHEDLVLGDKQTVHEQAHSEAVNGNDFQQIRLTEPKSSFVVHGKQKSSEKGEGKDYYSNDIWNNCEGIAINKKERKPKPDIDLNETYTVPTKASFLHGKEMHKLDKQGLNGMSVPRKGSMQVSGLPVPEEVKID